MHGIPADGPGSGSQQGFDDMNSIPVPVKTFLQPETSHRIPSNNDSS